MFKCSNLDTNLGTNLDTNSVTNPVTSFDIPIFSDKQKIKKRRMQQSTLLILIHLPQSRSQNQSRHHPKSIQE